MGKDINSFHLIDQNIDFDEDGFLSREIDDELAVPIPEEDLHASTLLNSEQQNAYNSILQKVLSNQAATFFIDGPASILPDGRTAHSWFKIPLDANKNSTCSVSKQSGLARLLQTVKLIIWDETPMSRKESIEVLDKMLKNINDSELSFGGKIIAVMEDFLHTLTPNGLPPHELLLKKNCPIMLLRNINPSEGLCNEKRLIYHNFDRNVIHAEIAAGHHSGKKVFIPRIPFLPSPDENSGFPFKRTQFPVKLSFAMSINKS
ncbi:hypothetical protein I3760_10G108500 [Carya illinoinensis]|nr:hypothetical protein I3760_10G108500 [Carya illinoinensis]